MSFSMTVKEELANRISSSRHCQLAELAAIYSFCGSFVQKNGKKPQIFLNLENDLVANKCFTLLKKAFTIYNDENSDDKPMSFDEEYMRITIEGAELCEKIDAALTGVTIAQRECCKRAYLRGAYLCVGTITNPDKSYHLEFVCRNSDSAEYIVSLFKHFSVDVKLVKRNKYFIAYIKDSEQISLALNVMDASLALMSFENTIILKNFRNRINRKNNCDTANINKTVWAAQNSISDIQMLMKTKEFDALPEAIKDIARLRLENPEATLQELGELSDPPLSKSGVNHRLRKLSEFAADMKKQSK